MRRAIAEKQNRLGLKNVRRIGPPTTTGSWRSGNNKVWRICGRHRSGGVDRPDVLSPVADEEETQLARRSRVEAVLLISREPVSARKLAQLAGVRDASEARSLARELNELYDRLNRGIRIEEIAGGFQMLTRKLLSVWVQRLNESELPERLTQSALETLALVAYRQPILRADIEAIRGVASGELLRQLIEKELVRIAGRSEELGRPYLYGTTRKFLRIFGLNSLRQLPKASWIAELSNPGDVDEDAVLDTSESSEANDSDTRSSETSSTPDDEQSFDSSPNDLNDDSEDEWELDELDDDDDE